ncbi:MAG: phenylalanine--tRNA ligase subunit beta [Candidatus Gracilibacteria bacterium]|nr:phenylalanine--tRNA ligase subunit beta [Candidatus Gracilibacteria bacterium]
MKISYKVIKNYIPDIKTAEEVAKDLVMHTAEVEDIIIEGENLEHVYIGEVITCEKHPDSEKLNCTTVKVNNGIFPIVCGAANVRTGLRVPVAVCGAKLAPDFIIKKTKIRGETSEGMICSEDELGLIKERQDGILELPTDAPLDVSMRDYLGKNDAILEIDNKAINHRPDLFSHIGVIREIYAINGKRFDFEYENRDFSKLTDLGIKNNIQKEVRRYIGLKIENVANIESPEYITKVLNSAEVNSKGLLIDISNYSLYLYGQPTHCFDADKIKGKIIIRFAKDGEKFLALNDVTYELTSEDIVIADDEKVLALGGIIGGKESSVTNETKNIIVEGAHFDQAIIRKTGKRLGVRTDSLNVFEKDILPEMAIRGVSLIASELEKNLDGIKITAFSDLYSDKQKTIYIDFDLEYINNLIGKKYSREEALSILNNLGIEEKGNKLTIPFWRKDLNFKSDIAEEIARIDGYDNIESTVPRINLGAVVQTNTYKIKNDSRNYFTNKGYFDMYTYSFVNEELMSKALGNTDDLVPMKNPLSEELTHLRGSLIPNLLLSLEKNIREYSNLKLFELEKIFKRNGNEINEYYSLAGLEVSNKDLVYYDIQNTIADLFKTIGVDKYVFDNITVVPNFAHSGRTASIIIRGEEVGTIGEINPRVAANFDVKSRIGYFEINIAKLEKSLYSITKAKELSNYQENNFDLSFVVDKDTKAKIIKLTIEKSNIDLITKVDMTDIYEDETKLPGKRSLSFKVFIQSMEGTLDDKIKNELINEIVKNVSKKAGVLR